MILNLLLFLLAHWLFILLLAYPNALFEGNLKILIRKFINPYLSQKIGTFGLSDDQLNWIFTLPSVTQNRLAGLFGKVV